MRLSGGVLGNRIRESRRDIFDYPDGSLRLRRANLYSQEEGRSHRPARHDVERDVGGGLVVRDTSGLVKLVRAKIDVMPLDAQIDLLRRRLQVELGRPVSGHAGPVVQLGGTHCLSESIQFEGGDIMIIVPPTFPFTAPVIVAGSGDESRQLPITWELDHGTQPESLATILMQHLGENGSWRLT